VNATTQDQELLRQYGEASSEAAFTELVNRYIGLVYATAVRQLRDPDLARDVPQMVFSDLARKARSLSPRVVLAGWLHQATRFAAAKVVRGERRRRAREQEAMVMHAPAQESAPDWDLLSPVLDSAIGELSTIDRDAVLLRFFERRDLQAIGTALGVSEEAARKRVARALERLRARLERRGVTLTGAALGVALTSGAMQSAPAGLAISIAATSLTGASAAAATGLAFPLLQAMTKTKLIVLAVAAALGIPLMLLWTQNVSLCRELAALRASSREGQRLLGARRGTGESGTSNPELRRLRKEHLELLSLRGRVSQLAQELRQRSGTGAATGDEPEPAPGTGETDSILFTAALTNRVNRGHTLVVGGWSKEGKRSYVLATPAVKAGDVGSDRRQVVVQAQVLEAPESFWNQIGWDRSRSDARRSTLSGVLTPEQVEDLRTALQDTEGSGISNASLSTVLDGERIQWGWMLRDDQEAGMLMRIDLHPRIAPDGESVDLELQPSAVTTNTPIHSSMAPAKAPVVPPPEPRVD
jgi:RNA polymerase sigma factor (sigma-70 family)